MATLAEIKTRIITELSRDDLEDELADQLTLHIARACEFYADERFWFNAIVTTAPTVAAVASVTIPDTVRRIERLTVGSSDLQEVVLTEIEVPGSTATGEPSRYAYYNDTVKLWPTPDAVYTLQITGLAQIDAPAEDTDENAWTVEAQDLIVGRVKETLCRGQFRDPEGAQLARAEVTEALGKLKRETARRLTTPLRPNGHWRRTSYNINTGY